MVTLSFRIVYDAAVYTAIKTLWDDVNENINVKLFHVFPKGFY